MSVEPECSQDRAPLDLLIALAGVACLAHVARCAYAIAYVAHRHHYPWKGVQHG